VLDIWDSQQAFERFQQDRLTAAVQKAGITGPPKVQFFPVHNLYAPNVDTIRQAGASSLPLGV
jgi:heme-degrading monooxygenase HmoA